MKKTFEVISLGTLQEEKGGLWEVNTAHYTGLEVEAKELEQAVKKARNLIREVRGEAYLRIQDYYQDEERPCLMRAGRPIYQVQEKPQDKHKFREPEEKPAQKSAPMEIQIIKRKTALLELKELTQEERNFLHPQGRGSKANHYFRHAGRPWNLLEFAPILPPNAAGEFGYNDALRGWDCFLSLTNKGGLLVRYARDEEGEINAEEITLAEYIREEG